RVNSRLFAANPLSFRAIPYSGVFIMTTAAQIAANRRNAQRSTGPRTPQGKARSSANARKHGINGKELRIPGDDIKGLAEQANSLRRSLAPRTATERLLVNEILAAVWRLGRIRGIEAQHYRRCVNAAGEFDLCQAFCDGVSGLKTLEAVLRQELHLE